MRYINYIFDLYATLVDIHTNEEPADFWWRVASLLNLYGAVYEPGELRKRYRELVVSDEERLAQELHTDLPEIELGDVFKVLILTPPKSHGNGIWGEPHLWSKEELDMWCGSFAYAFRVLSRVKYELYPDTIELLESLRSAGKHIYLLSNAQDLFTRPEMMEVDITKYFDDIFISSEHGMKKPEVRFMRELLEKHHLDLRQSVMIGNDMQADILMAARCGVNAILVNHDGYTQADIKHGFDKARSIVPAGRRGGASFHLCPDLASVVKV